jgi:uncharacterized spore protein YtfJ
MAESFLSSLESLGNSASVKSVSGDAVSANGKTMIPVARVAYGFGGGGGRKRSEGSPQEDEGGSGGLYRVPVGVVEVTDTDTRFIPLHDKRRLAGAALVGFC